MRLSCEVIAAIRRLVQAGFGTDAGIWLFGSRLDDNACGGDVDFYMEPDHLPEENLLLARQALRRDLVVNPGRTTAFVRQARAEGHRL